MKHLPPPLQHPKSGIPSTSYVYHDATGCPVLVANRFDSKDGGKYFLPYDVLRDVWKAPKPRPIYNLHLITSSDPGTPIVLVEGEKCADALTELGYLCTTTFGGSNAFHLADTSPLEGRKIVIWPDLDQSGEKYAKAAQRVLSNLPTTTVSVVPISAEFLRNIRPFREVDGPSKGWDVADAVAEGWVNSDIDALLSYAEVCVSSVPQLAKGHSNFGEVCALWHTPENEPFASVVVGGHVEHWPIESAHFRNYVAHHHYLQEGKMMTTSALEDRRRAMIGEALFDAPEYPVFTRIGHLNGRVHIDLGDEDWSSVEIDRDGWQIEDRSQVRFQRSNAARTLPKPVGEVGNVELLRPFLNVASDRDFKMLVAWLLGCFHPKGPYPILILTGEQGSAKSTTAKVLRSLIDPARPMARSAPQSEQDLVIAARNNHVLAFDNLSSVKPAMADALCRIATGGGFGTRKLHTNSEEVLFNATRPCLLNGIPDLASRPDLADRSIVVNLPPISERDRQYEGVFWKSFDGAAPQIMGGLLNAVSTAIARLGSVTLTDRPRMADFARWVTAAESALGWEEGSFLEAYQFNRSSTEGSAIESNPVAEVVLDFAQKVGNWKGTATELLQVLRRCYPLVTEDAYSFPRHPNRLTGDLRRIAPLLRKRGFVIGHSRSGPSGQRILEIMRFD